MDWFHAAERLRDAAKALFPGDRASLEHWAEARGQLFEASAPDGLLPPLRAHAGNCEAAASCVGYIKSNRERMRYAEFRAQGLQIGSGVVETACKSVVGGRLKQGGMRWTKEGAEANLALRSCILSGPTRTSGSGAARTGSLSPPDGRGPFADPPATDGREQLSHVTG